MQWNLYDVLAILAAYLIGNISPAIILGKLSGVDIKKEGSGNAGTTNVLRVLGKKAAFITLVIDIAKGFLAVRLGMLFGYETGAVCAVAVFCGHIWPCFYRFKGGKGVATAFGALLAINWMLGLRHWPSLRPASSSVNACRLARYLARLLSRSSVII